MASPTINRPSSGSQLPPMADQATAELQKDQRVGTNENDPADAQRANLKKAEGQAKFVRSEGKKTEAQQKSADADAKLTAQGQKKGIAEVLGKDAVFGANERQGASETVAAQTFSLEQAPPQDKLAWAAAFDKLASLLPDAPPTQVGEQFSVAELARLATPILSALDHAPSLHLAQAIETLSVAPLHQPLIASQEAAVEHKDAPENAAGKFTRIDQSIKTFQAFQRLVQRFYDGGLTAKTPQAELMLKQMPPAAMVQFQQGTSKIVAAYKQFLSLTSPSGLKNDDWDSPAGDHVPQLPPPALALMQEGMGSVVSAMRSAGRKVVTAIDDEGQAAIGHSEGDGAGSSVGGGSDTQFTSGSTTIDWDTVDIESLMIMVMMHCTETEGDLLKDKLIEMDAANRQKKELRAAKTAMKEQAAKLESQMLNEFNQLKAEGAIAASIKFEDYKAWRQVQWADVDSTLLDDGTHSFGLPPTASSLQQPSPPVDIPSWMVTGNTDDAKNAVEKGGDIFSQAGLPRTVKAALQKVFDGLPEADKKAYGDLAGFMQGMGLIIPPESKDDVVSNLNAVHEAVEAAAAKAAQSRDKASLGALKWNDLRPEGRLAHLAEQAAIYQALAAAGVEGAKEKAKEVGDDLKKMLAKNFPGGECPADGPFPGMSFPEAVEQLMRSAADAIGASMTIVKGVLDGIAAGAPGNAEGLADRVRGSVAEQIAAGLAGGPYGALLAAAAAGGSALGVPGAAWLADKFGGAGHGALEGFKAGWNLEDETHAMGIGGLVLGILGGIGGFLGGLFGDTDVSCDGVNVGFGSGGVNGSLTMWYDEPWPSENHHETVGLPTQDMSALPPDGAGPAAGAVQQALGELGAGNLSSAQLGKMTKELQDFGGEFTCTGKEAGSVDKDGHALAGADDFDEALEDLDHVQQALDDPNSTLSKVLDRRFKPKDDKDKNHDAALDAQNHAAAYASNGAGGYLQNQGNLAQMDAAVQKIDDQLQAISEMNEIDSLKLQTLMERRGKFIEALSNMLKKLSGLDETIAQNWK